jgi:hypothetical protein
MFPISLLGNEYRRNELKFYRLTLPLPQPDDQGRCVILTRNAVFPQDVKIVDMMRTNLMMLDIILEENDRVVICGSVNVMDHENNNLALMAQVTPAIMKKMTTIFQVTFAEPLVAFKYSWHCYTF